MTALEREKCSTHSLQPSILGTAIIPATQKRQKAHLKFEEMPYISVGSLASLNSLPLCLMRLTGSPSQCLATSLFKGGKACQSRMKVKPASCLSGETPQPQSLSMNFMSPGPFKDHLVLFTTLNSSALNQTQQLGADSAPQDHRTFCVSMPFPSSWTPPRGHECPTNMQRTGWTTSPVRARTSFNSLTLSILTGKRD